MVNSCDKLRMYSNSVFFSPPIYANLCQFMPRCSISSVNFYMPISAKNIEKLNNLEKTLREQMLWVSRNGIQHIIDTINSLRTFKQFTIGLSAGIIGIVFPLLLTAGSIKNTNAFLITLGLFSYVIICGFFQMILPYIREVVELPKVSEKSSERILKFIKELQEIRKIDDNDEAGRKFEELKEHYRITTPNQRVGILKKLWHRYEILIFFGAFIVGYAFFIYGLFINFIN